MTLAKPLAGGLPIGVTLVRDRVSAVIQVGDHGSTFGGGPVVCRAGLVSLSEITREGFLDQVRERGSELKAALGELPSNAVREVRGQGLLIGVQLDRPVRPIIEKALAEGLLIINAGEDVIRLCPPLTISNEQIDRAVEILDHCLYESNGQG
jgi:acetylornithine aminotransferase